MVRVHRTINDVCSPPPLATCTANNLLTIEPYGFGIKDVGLSSQALQMAASNSAEERKLCPQSLFARKAQQCSTGLQLGDCDGQGSSSFTFSFRRYLRALFDLWQLAPSCIKITPPCLADDLRRMKWTDGPRCLFDSFQVAP